MKRSGSDVALRFSRRQALRHATTLGLATTLGHASDRPTGAAPRRQIEIKGGGGTMIAAIAGDPGTFNLNLQPDSNAVIAARNIFRSLVTFDLNYAVQPDLAEEWSISDDGLVYTFTLDRSATWHDGETVAASDVQTTLNLILEDDTAPAHDHLAVIASVDTPNDRTVTLTLNRPSASLLPALANDWAFILPSHLYLSGDWRTNPANLEPVGLGPFRFLSYTPGGSIDLGAFHEFDGRGPYLDRLLLQVMPDPERAASALLNGEIDLITYPLPAPLLDQMRQEPGITVSDVLQPRTWFLGFNLARDPIRDLAVRQRVAAAIDREQLVSAAMGGAGVATSAFIPSLLVPGGRDAESVSASSNAGAEDVNASGDLIILTLVYEAGSATAANLAAALTDHLRDSSITIEPVGLEQDAWNSHLASGDFDLALIDGPRWPDPSALRELVGSDGRDNFWSFANPEVDDLFTAADEAMDQTTRAAAFADLEQILADDPPLLPLLSPRTPYVFTNQAIGLPYVQARVPPLLHRFNPARLRTQPG